MTKCSTVARRSNSRPPENGIQAAPRRDKKELLSCEGSTSSPFRTREQTQPLCCRVSGTLQAPVGRLGNLCRRSEEFWLDDSGLLKPLELALYLRLERVGHYPGFTEFRRSLWVNVDLGGCIRHTAKFIS